MILLSPWHTFAKAFEKPVPLSFSFNLTHTHLSSLSLTHTLISLFSLSLSLSHTHLSSLSLTHLSSLSLSLSLSHTHTHGKLHLICVFSLHHTTCCAVIATPAVRKAMEKYAASKNVRLANLAKLFLERANAT